MPVFDDIYPIQPEQDDLKVSFHPPSTLTGRWNFSHVSKSMLEHYFRCRFEHLVFYFRLYRLQQPQAPLNKSGPSFRDYPVSRTSSCSIHELEPGFIYAADVGLLGRTGNFIPLVRSRLLGRDGETIEHTSAEGSGFFIPKDWKSVFTFKNFNAYTVYHSGPAAASQLNINVKRTHPPSRQTFNVPESKEETPGSTSILMLAWEFPPNVIGGLSAAVYALACSLADLGNEVHVITCASAGSPVSCDLIDGVTVHRVPGLWSAEPVDFTDGVFQMNLAFANYAVRLVMQGTRFDLIHAHDWLVYDAARELSSALQLPLVATIHSTEYGRTLGHIHGEYQQYIHRTESALIYEAKRVIVCSMAMAEEVQSLTGVSPGKLTVIPNGIRCSSGFMSLPDTKDLSLPNKKPLLLYLGRLVYEKGVQHLIEALKLLQGDYPQTKLIIAGTGPFEDSLKSLALPLGNSVHFAAFAAPGQRDILLRTADACIIPSLYEPFGMVALEAMHGGCPAIVSDTGGLAEIIEHGVNGLKAVPGDSASLAGAIKRLLSDPPLARKLVEEAKHTVEAKYSGRKAAEASLRLYHTLSPPDQEM